MAGVTVLMNCSGLVDQQDRLGSAAAAQKRLVTGADRSP